MDQDDVRVGLLTVAEMADSAGISVERALGILRAGGYSDAREPGDEIGEEAQQCVAEGLAVSVTDVAGGYSADFFVECAEDGVPFARHGLLTFSRFGYSDTCWPCGRAARCLWGLFESSGPNPMILSSPRRFQF